MLFVRDYAAVCSSHSFACNSPATIRPPPNMRFYFVTSWVLFLEGLSGISGLAVSYFYKDTLKVDPATLTQVSTLLCIYIHAWIRTRAFPAIGTYVEVYLGCPSPTVKTSAYM